MSSGQPGFAANCPKNTSAFRTFWISELGPRGCRPGTEASRQNCCFLAQVLRSKVSLLLLFFFEVSLLTNIYWPCFYMPGLVSVMVNKKQRLWSEEEATSMHSDKKDPHRAPWAESALGLCKSWSLSHIILCKIFCILKWGQCPPKALFCSRWLLQCCSWNFKDQILWGKKHLFHLFWPYCVSTHTNLVCL